MMHRLVKTGAAARGRYAALQPAREVQDPKEAIAPDNAYVAATVYTATTLEWLMNMWDANSSMEDIGGLDDSFDAQQNHYYPQP